ncbi:MAG: glutathione peroxidase [Erysipelotrichaceae bacterium]
MNIYDFTVQTMSGEKVDLSIYHGKVLVIVNTASHCGFTPQFAELESLYHQFEKDDFEILGFPCNQFGHQDPGTNQEILEFCQINYGVTFPMMAKVDVNGDNADPLFVYLRKQTKTLLSDKIKWNFTKFLINKEGKVIKRYGPATTPKQMEADIKMLLKGESK